MIHLDSKMIGKVDMKSFVERVEENNKIHVSTVSYFKGYLKTQKLMNYQIFKNVFIVF